MTLKRKFFQPWPSDSHPDGINLVHDLDVKGKRLS